LPSWPAPTLVCLESIADIRLGYGPAIKWGEWILTGLFTIEYGLRLYCAPRRWHYAKSFFGIVDFISILPTFLALLLPSATYLVSIRLLRLLRIFRILKLLTLSGEARLIIKALQHSMAKIAVFFYGILILVFIEGTLMYLVEGGLGYADSEFDSIPRSVYWAIVTMTTVGYGDIVPMTPMGQVLASMIMLTGYAIIAVPTGIVAAEFNLIHRQELKDKGGEDALLDMERECKRCGLKGHTLEARFCRRCGEEL
jgi:voltage-gated potassium channel